MEERSSSERKNLLIKTISIVILLLLALLSSILYIFAYPKTKVILYDSDYRILKVFEVKKHSKLTTIPEAEKEGYTFQYWTYEDGDILDPNRELDGDTLNLYAVYNINSYKVTYHVQVLNPVTGKYEYKEDVQGCLPQIYEFGQTFRLPTGKDANGNYISEFAARKGHTFVGWTTKVYTEEDPDRQVYNAGGEFIVPAGNIDLYAHWEKNRYQVVLHTGIEYQFENGVPVKDENGDFIIKNNQEEATKPEIQYLDYLSGLTDKYSNITLNEERDGLGAEEYDFKGWYLDPDYIVKADNYNVEVNVDENGVPYFKYLDENEEEKMVYAVELDGYYQFHLYSKWERRAYNLTFNKNTNRSSGKIDPIQVYKYDDLYGKYYNTDVFTRLGQENGDYFHTLDLSNLEITSEAFLSSNKNYRFIGWTTNADASRPDNVWYYQWTQSKEIEESSYINKVYKHEVSENVTLYAQWARVYTITFADSTSVNKKTFIKEGIEGEWFNLPSYTYISELNWTKDYNSFAGWTTNPSSSLATRYYELLDSGEKNPNYIYTISRTNAMLYVLWEREQYRVDFYLNYGSENNSKGEIYTTYYPVYGGSSKSYPSAPVREGYIFDGWSQTKYADNVLNKTDAYTSAKSFKVVGNAEYYASWTLNYSIEYDANGGIGTLPKTLSYKNNYRDLKMTVSVGGGTKLQMAGHTFGGWLLKKNDNNLDTSNIISSGTKLVFDFVNKVVYKESNPSVTYPMNLEGDLDDKVVLYAYWEPRQFSITLVDTLNNNAKTIEKATYGVDFVFPIFNKDGYKFDGWTSELGGTVIYTPGSAMPGSSVVSNYTFYTSYSIKKIALEYWYKDVNGEERQYTQTGAFSCGTINYNQTIILPTPGNIYGDSTYIFKEWFYLDEISGEEVLITTGEQVRYEGDKLILWARFEKEKYSAIFEINLPDGKSATDPISLELDKNYVVTQEFIDELQLKVNKIIEEKGIKAYSFAGFYNSFYGNAVNPLKLVVGQVVNSITFPVLGASSTIKFTSYWLPNSVNFVYRSSESDYEQNTSFHTGLNYESTSDVILKTQDELGFNLGAGINVTRWYIKETANADRKAYFTVGTNLIGGSGYISISELDKYITWYLDGESYTGFIYLYAETEQIFDITYYRYKDGAEEEIKQEQVKYDAYNNVLSLASGTEAVYGNMIFNGWRLGSISGDLITSYTLELSPERFRDYKVKLYADMSFNIVYKNVVINNGIIDTVTLKIDTYNYYINGSYVNSLNIKDAPDLETLGITIPDGYNYYGLKYNDNIYTLSQVASDGINVSFDGNTQTIICYLTKVITITYTLSSNDEVFEDSTTENKAFSYQMGYDGTQIDTIRVKNLLATKPSHIFVGWSISYNGIADSKVYSANEQLLVTENTTLVGVFEIPQAGNIDAVITYLEDDSDTAKSISFDVKNGDKYTLLGGSELGSSWTSLTRVIIGWRYTNADGSTVDYNIHDTFNVPLAITSGDVFEFVAIWEEYYTIKFDTDLEDATIDTLEKTILNGEEFKLSTTEEPKLPEGSTTIFQYWTYKGVIDSETGANPIIRIGDIVKISNKTNSYRKDETFEYTIHTIPKVSGVWEYTLKAIWDKEDFIITLNITNPDNVEDPNEIKLNYTIGGTANQKVYYGDTYTARELLSAEALAIEATYPNKGIIGWRLENGDPATPNHSLISNITSNLTLYSVWQTKYTLTYGASDSDFGYKTEAPETEYFFANDTINLDVDIIKSIYKKGYYTVYFDNGEYVIYQDGTGTDYYTVVGFRVTNDSDSTTTDVYFSVDGYSIVTPASNITLTPIFESAYKVEFYANGLDDTEILHTAYKVSGDDLLLAELNTYTAYRLNFTFVGWNTDKDASTAISNIYDITENQKLYAIWQSNLTAKFYLRSEKVFEISLNRISQIPSSILSEYLTSESGNESNGYLANSKLAGNANVYTYSDANYYLNGFIYNGTVYTLDELCALTLNNNIVVNLSTENVYTVKYSTAEGEEVTGDINTIEYITSSGKLTDTSKSVTFTLPLPSVSKAHHTPIGWSSVEDADDMSARSWLAGYEFTSSNISDLTELSQGQLITIYVKWEEERYTIKVNYLKEGLDLYTVYSSSIDGTDEEFLNSFENVISFVKDTNGTTMTESGGLQLTYGQIFQLSTPATRKFGNYYFVGWSTTLYKLGEITESTEYYEIINNKATSQITVTEDLLNVNNELVFYPVYTEALVEIQVSTIDGQAQIDITNNDKLKGFIYDGGYATDTSIIIDSNKINYITFNYYNDVVVTANAPKTNYDFDAFEGIGTTNNDTPTIRLISYSQAITNNSLIVKYKPQEVEVTLELVYTNELKSTIATDGSTVIFGSTTLSASNKTETITLLATDTLDYSINISDYFKLQSVTSGGETIQISSSISVSDLIVADKKSNIVVTLAPKTYTVTFNLNNGVIEDNIIVTSNVYEGIVPVTLDGNKLDVVAGGVLTLPTPTKVGYIFTQWLVDGVEFTEATKSITANTSFTAMYFKNQYIITYNVKGAETQVALIGGNPVIIAESIEFNQAGEEIDYWEDQYGVKYKTGDEVTLNKQDYKLTAVIKGKDVTITYHYGTNNSLTTNQVVEYGKPVTVKAQSDLDGSQINGKNLYAWTLNIDGTGELISAGEENVFSMFNFTYDETDGANNTIHIYAVYFVQYKFTINYALGSEISTAIPSETYYVNAKNGNGEVEAKDLKYVISSVEPKYIDNALIFTGYNVKIGSLDNDIETGIIIACGGVLNLTAPTDKNVLEYVYYLVPDAPGSSEGTTQIRFYITNPQEYLENSSTDIYNIATLTIDNSNVESENGYYSIPFFTSNKLGNNYLPQNNLTSTWTITTGGSTFTISTFNNFAGYKLLGYKIYAVDLSDNILGLVTTINLTDAGDSGTRNIAYSGASHYRAYAIWEQRYLVNYFDQNGDTPIASISGYVDKNSTITLVTVESYNSLIQNYTLDGHILIGLTNRLTTSTSPILLNETYYSFENPYIVTGDVNFYPAFAKLYSVVIDVDSSKQTLLANGGDPNSLISNITTEENGDTLVPQIYVGNETIDLTKLCGAYYSAGIGYDVAGFSLIAEKMAYELNLSDIFKTYTLDISDADENAIITFYIVMDREVIDVEFKINAEYKDGTKVSNRTLTKSYYYNETINLDTADIVALKTLDNFSFVNFTLDEAGSNSAVGHKVIAGNTIFVNFNPIYRLQFVIPDGATCSTLPEVRTIRVGDEIAYFDPANIDYEDYLAQNWYLEGTDKSLDFFTDGNAHIISEADLAYANNEYILVIKNNWNADYLVSIAYFASYEDLQSGTYSYTDELIFKVSDCLFPNLDNPLEDNYNKFDGKFTVNGQAKNFVDLMTIFEINHYTMSYDLIVNGVIVRLTDYIVKQYGENNPNRNIIQLNYSPTKYSITMISALATINESGEYVYSNDIDATAKYKVNNSEEDYDTLSGYGEYLTYLDTITLLSTVENNFTNKYYNFIGWMIVTGVDEHGHTSTIEASENDKFGSIIADYGFNIVSENTYSITHNVIVYAVFVDRLVDVKVVMQTEDNDVSTVETNIKVNGATYTGEIEYTTETISGVPSKVAIAKIKYGSSLEISGSDTIGAYEVERIGYSGIYLYQNNFVATLEEDYGIVDDEFELTLYYKLKTINVYLRTTLDTNIFEYSQTATVESYTYLDKSGVSQTGTDVWDMDTIYNGKVYDKVLTVPFKSVINNTIATPILNNYTLSSWNYNGSQFAGGGILSDTNIVLTDNIYLEAIYTPNEITIEFYGQDDNILQGISYTHIDTNSDGKLTYGDSIILPYVIVNGETSISIKWDKGEFGEELLLINGQVNAELEDNIYKITAWGLDKYYVVFSNNPDDIQFDIPSDYPTTSNNNFVVAYENFSIDSGIDYYYIEYDLVNGVYGSLQELTTTAETTIISNEITIPNVAIADKDNLAFDYWATISNREYTIGDTYTFSYNDIENNIIKLISKSSNFKNIKFYITNPYDDANNTGDEYLKLSKSAVTPDYSMEFFPVVFNVLNTAFYNLINIEDSNNKNIAWKNSASLYFSDNSTDVLANYKFYGWSIDKNAVIYDIESSYSSLKNRSALLYTWSNGELTNTNTNSVNQKLYELIMAGHTTFYSVWEVKHSVTFDASDSAYTNGFNETQKYGAGEIVEMPNPSNRNLINGNQKWTGWKDQNGNNYPFSTSNYLTTTIQDVILTPTWVAGVNVYFDINFDSQREYFANVMQSVGSNTLQTIYTKTGVPIINPTLSGYVSHQTSIINSVQYTTVYKEGGLWGVGDVIDTTRYDDANFVHSGIYYLDSITSETLSKYFYLAGWVLASEGTTYLSSYTIKDSDIAGGSITFKAIWKPVELTVNFYYNKTSAINADSSSAYRDAEGNVVTINVPFGSNLSTLDYSSYNSKLNNYVNIYQNETYNQAINPPANMQDYSNNDYWRFNFWSNSTSFTDTNIFGNVATGNFEEDSVSSSRVTYNLRLYPTFIRQYEVEFVTLQGTPINSTDINQKVIDQEDIIISILDEIVDMNIVSEIYYYDPVGNKVDIGTDTDVITFIKSGFGINRDKYIYIYVDVNIKVQAYIPVYNTDGTTSAVPYGEAITLTLGNDYNINTMYQISDDTLRSYTNSNNYPTFGGWCLDVNNLGSNYYNLSNSRAYVLDDGTVIEWFGVVSTKSGSSYSYSVEADGQLYSGLTIENRALLVKVYLKLLTSNTISLGTTSDNIISNYGYLTIEDSENSEDLQKYYEITSAVVLEDAKNGASAKYKSITYTSVYFGGKSPVVTLNTNYGYTITDTNNADFDTLISNNTSVANGRISGEYSNYNITINRTSNSEVDANGSDQLRVTNDIQITNIKNTNYERFELYIAPIVYSVEYNYVEYTTESIDGAYLTYQTSNTLGASSYTFSDTSGELQIYGGILLYGHGGAHSQSASAKIQYVLLKDGHNVTIRFTNVPYGITLFNTFTYGDHLLKHFAYFDTNGLDNIGKLENGSQTFTPINLNGNNYVFDFSLTPVFENNEVEKINFVLDFDETYFERNSSWHNLLQKARLDGYNLSEYEIGGHLSYRVTWDIWTNGGVFAGDNIENIINQYNARYNSDFNTSIATDVSGLTNITSLSVLLNYFWFTGEWFSYDENSNTGVFDNLTNIIKVDTNGVVTLYSHLEKGLIVTTEHQAIDYTQDSKIYGLDRADVELLKVTATIDGNTQTMTAGTDYFVFTRKLTGSPTGTDTLIVKMPFGYEVEVKVNPVSHTVNYNNYIPYTWLLNTNNNRITADGFAYTQGGNSATIDTDNKGKDMFYKYTLGFVPEIKAVAQVVVDTYNLTFVNTHGSNYTYKLGYDLDIYKLNTTQNYYYASTLNTLRMYFNMPLFAIDPQVVNTNITTGLTTIRHSEDDGASIFGQFKYLLQGWTLENTSGALLVDTSNKDKLISYTSASGYSDVTLYTKWYKNVKVNYNIYATTGDIITFTYYLPAYDLVDNFGTVYPTTLALQPALQEIKDAYPRYDLNYVTNSKDQFGLQVISSNGALYEMGINDQSHKVVTTVGDCAVRDNTIEIYPVVNYVMPIYQNRVQMGEYYISALGGKYILTNISTGTNKGYIQVSNVVLASVEEGIIVYNTLTRNTFAYWDLFYTAEDMPINEPYDELFLGNSINMYHEIFLNAHYNPTFNVVSNEDSKGKGKITFVDSNGQDLIGYNIALLEGAPTNTNLTSYSGTNAKAISVKYSTSTSTYAKLEITGGSQNYVIEYNANSGEILKAIYWVLTFEDNNKLVLGKGETYIVEDLNGAFNIEIMVTGEDIGIIVDTPYLFVENFPTSKQTMYSNSNYVSFDKTSISAVESGSPIVVEYNKGYDKRISLSTSDRQTSMEFKDILYGNTSASLTATFTSKFITQVYDNIYDLRWQYHTGSGWLDITDVGAFVDDYTGSKGMKIRLACKWYTSEVEFAGLNTKSTGGAQPDLTTTTVTRSGVSKSFDVKYGVELDDSLKFVYVNSNKYAKTTLTLYKGDSLVYTQSNEQYRIDSTIDKNGTIISINDQDGSFPTAMFSQGWFALESKALSIQGDNTISITGSQTLKFVAWVEEKVSSEIKVDRNTYPDIVNGYGLFNYTIQNVKATVNPNNPFSPRDIDYSTYTTFETGKSSYVSIWADADETNVNHKFKQFTSLRDESGNPYKNISYTNLSATMFGGDIYVLFDATDTKSQYVIQNEINEIKKEIDIYGGYTITYSKSGTNVKVIVTDMFESEVEAFTIYVNATGTNSDTNSSLYPRNHYKIKEIFRWRGSTGELYPDFTDANTSVYDATTKDLKVTTYKYIGTNSSDAKDNKSDNESIVDVFDEYPYEIKLNYVIEIKDDVDNTKSTTKSNEISLTTAYLETAISNASNSKYYLQKTISVDEEYLDLWYSVHDLGVYLDISNREYEDIIKYNAEYRLHSVGVYNDETLVTGFDTNDIITEEEWPLLYPEKDNKIAPLTGNKVRVHAEQYEYNLKIVLEEKKTIELTFKSTLPHESDYLNLGLMEYNNGNVFKTIGKIELDGVKYAGGTMEFNAGVNIENAETQVATFTVEIPKGYPIYYTNNGNQITLNIGVDGQIGSISYTPNANMYETIGSSGWWVTYGEEYNLFRPQANTFSGGEITSYKTWEFDTSASNTYEVTQNRNAHKLNTDACIVLAMQRKAVTITVDNGSYWNNNYYDYTTYSATNGFGNNEILTYNNVKNITGTTYKVPGGLALLIPSNYDRYKNGTGTETTASKDAFLAQTTQGTTTSVYYANNVSNIRLGLQLNVEDSSTRARFDMASGTLNTAGKITTLTPIKTLGYINPSYAIFGTSSNTTFNIELTTSSDWRIITIPYGDANFAKRDITGQYTKVTYYSYPKTTKYSTANETNYTGSNTGITINTLSSTLRLLQSPKNDCVEGVNLSSWTTYFYQNKYTRLYDDMYDAESYVLNPYYHKSSDEYAVRTLTYNNPLKFGGDYISGNYRRILTGYTYVVGTNTPVTIKREQFTDRAFELDISTYSEISIYPVWEFVKTYDVIINNPTKFNDDHNLNQFTLRNILEGDGYNPDIDLYSTRVVASVSSSSVDSGYIYTLRANSATGGATTGDTYLFLGFTTIADNTGNAQSGIYTKGSYSSAETFDYNRYGLHRIVISNGTYSIVTSSTNSNADDNILTKTLSSGKLKFEFTPSKILEGTNDRVINLYPVWAKLGYSVDYKFAKVGYSTYGLDQGTNASCSDSTYAKRTTGSMSSITTSTVTYADFIDGMPFRTGDNFTYAGNTSYPTSNFKQYTWFKGGDQTAWNNGTQECNGYNVVLPKDILVSGKATIAYSIAHTGCDNVTTFNRDYYECSGDHTYHEVYDVNCKYCQYHREDDYDRNTRDAYWTAYQYLDSEEHITYYKCRQCNSTIDSDTGMHDYMYYDTVDKGVCKERERQKCDDCGHIKEVGDTYTAHENLETNRVKTAATCTTTGIKQNYCHACKKWVGSERTISALGHDWTSWTTKSAATCTNAEVEERFCNRCNSGHSQSGSGYGTRNGDSALGHSLGSEYLYDDYYSDKNLNGSIVEYDDTYYKQKCRQKFYYEVYYKKCTRSGCTHKQWNRTHVTGPVGYYDHDNKTSPYSTKDDKGMFHGGPTWNCKYCGDTIMYGTVWLDKWHYLDGGERWYTHTCAVCP